MEQKITGDPDAAAGALIRYLERGGADVFGAPALARMIVDLVRIESEFATNVPLPNEAGTGGPFVVGDTEREEKPKSDDDDDEDSDAASAVSQTSTVVYCQEPFDAFKEHVMTLAQTTIWPGADYNDIEIERIRGGSFHRVIGLARRNAQTGEDTRHVLRIPRQNDAQNVYTDAAVLLFVQRYTNIPIPRIIRVDGTSCNALESPYMVQERMMGKSGYSAWLDLSHQQKCQLARQLGSAVRDMLAVKSHTAGRFYLPENDHSLHAAVLVLPLKGGQDHFLHKEKSPSLATALPHREATPTEDTQALLLRMIAEEKAEAPDFVIEEMYDRCERMTNELGEGGWLKDINFSLAHLDFEARNVHVNPEAAVGSPTLTGILDWDSALLAPAFVGARPLQWVWEIWDPTEQDDELGENWDEATANDEPETLEAKELKSLFEEAAGETYMRFAYQAEYRLARTMFGLLLGGMGACGDDELMLDMLREWKSLYGGYPEGEDWLLDPLDAPAAVDVGVEDSEGATEAEKSDKVEKAEEADEAKYAK